MFPYNPFPLSLIALVPGVVIWWTGRRVAARTSDPALPELLWAHQQRTRSVFMTTFFVLIFLGGRHAFWSVPLMGIAATIGGNPLRRALGIESANLLRQVWRNAKSVVGGLGFWIALALIPEIVLSIDPHYRALGLLIVPVLFAWEHWYRPIWLRAHDAELITDASLMSRFVAIDARAGIASPRVYRIGGRDSRFVNAFAFPDIRDPAIGLGNALIELLDPDEAAAIYAHELSHIEQSRPRRIQRRQLLTRSLIIVGALLPLGIAAIAPDVAKWVPWVWPLISIGAISLRGKKSRERETACDLRAAALCGDAEVVIRALIKTHVHAFIPRRWDVDFERQATHPSLTRRIQALRGESVQPSVAPEVSGMFRTAREGSVVAFDNARAYWFDGVPADAPLELDALRNLAGSSRSVMWGELVELRVNTVRDSRALQAKHANGDSWSVPLESSQVESMQKALDVVDTRLRREVGKAPMLDMRLVMTCIIVAMLWAAEVSVLLIPALIGLFKPSTVMLAALGSMAVVSGLFGVVREWTAGGGLELRLGLLTVAGFAALGAAWYRTRREKKIDGVRLTAITCGAVAALLLAPIALSAIELPTYPVAQRGTVTGVAMMLVGLSTALLFVPTRASKIGAVGSITLAAVLSAPSIEAMGLFSGASRFARARATATEIGRVALDGNAMELSVSPKGDRFLVREIPNGVDEDDDEEGSRRVKPRYTVGSFNGRKRTFDALQAALVDESRLLVLRRAEGGLELRLESEDSAAVWTVRLPAARYPLLTVSPRDHRWTILSEERELDSVLVISGNGDGGEPVVRRMATGRRARNERGAYDMGQTLPLGDRIVAPAFDYKPRGPSMLAMFTMTPRVDLWETTLSGEQKVGNFEGMPQCGMTEDARAICVVHQQSDRSQLWTIDRTGPARYEGIAPVGDIARVSIGPGARVSGMRLSDATVVVVDVAARKVWNIKLPADSGFASEARIVPGRVTVLRLENGKSVLFAYKVDGL